MTHTDTIPPKPSALTVLPQNIPDTLKDLSQWVFWRYTWNDRRRIWDKPPFQAHSGNLADSSNPKTWSGFETALNACQTPEANADGIGYMFTKKHRQVGGDLDDCRDPETGTIQPWAQAVIDQVNTYTEVSTSGTGVHFIAEGQLPGRGLNVRYPVDWDVRHVELYDNGRYFATTGHHVPGTPTTIEARQEAITALYRSLRNHQTGSQQRTRAPHQNTAPVPRLTMTSFSKRLSTRETGRSLPSSGLARLTAILRRLRPTWRYVVRWLSGPTRPPRLTGFFAAPA